jgi:D-alanyl-D-alanine dipeptidase
MPETSEGFVDIEKFIPSIRIDLRYGTTNNFVGCKIDGYDRPKCLLTRTAAEALKKVQEELVPRGLSLKIFDAYRPLRAVAHFARWAKDPSDQKMKAENYPSTDKGDLFRDGYISPKSAHSRGSTVDLTLVDLKTDKELDMGTPFDFFDPLSDTGDRRITKAQHDNRMTLKSVMERHGFQSLKREWWHFTLRNEPYPDTYFDFKID